MICHDGLYSKFIRTVLLIDSTQRHLFAHGMIQKLSLIQYFLSDRQLHFRFYLLVFRISRYSGKINQYLNLNVSWTSRAFSPFSHVVYSEVAITAAKEISMGVGRKVKNVIILCLFPTVLARPICTTHRPEFTWKSLCTGISKLEFRYPCLYTANTHIQMSRHDDRKAINK